MRLVFFPCFPKIVLRDMRRDSFRFRCEILHPHRKKLYIFPFFCKKWKWKSYPINLPYFNFLFFSVCLQDYGLAFQVINFVHPLILPLPCLCICSSTGSHTLCNNLTNTIWQYFLPTCDFDNVLSFELKKRFPFLF